MSFAFSALLGQGTAGAAPATASSPPVVSGRAEVAQQQPAAQAFALLLAGLTGEVPAPSALPALPEGVPPLPAAPQATLANDAAAPADINALPWDALSAAAEEAGRLAAIFQWPQPQQAQAATALPPQSPDLVDSKVVQGSADTFRFPEAAAASMAMSQTVPDLAPAEEPSRPAEPAGKLAATTTVMTPAQAPVLSGNAERPVSTEHGQASLPAAMPGSAPPQNRPDLTSATSQPAANSIFPAAPPPPPPPQATAAAAMLSAEPAQDAPAPPLADTELVPQGVSVPPRRAPVATAAAGKVWVSAASISPADPTPAAMPLAAPPRDTVVAAPEVEAGIGDPPASPSPDTPDAPAASAASAPDLARPSAPATQSAPPTEPDPLAAAPSQAASAPHGTAPQPAAAPAAVPQSSSQRASLAAEAAPQLVMRMAQAKQDGVDRVSVDLRPPELGRVELQMTFRDGTVHVVMRAEQPDTFEALRQDRHHLEQQMAEAGLQLGAGGLDLQQGRLPQPRPEAAPRPTAMTAAPGDDAEAEAAAGPRPLATDSLIDIIA